MKKSISLYLKKLNGIKITSSETLSDYSRACSLLMAYLGKSSHIGSAFSCIDIVSCIYFNFLKNKNNDIILSKGHAGLSIYSCLAAFKKIKQKDILNYLSDNSLLCGHVTNKGIKEIKLSTGSLGNGLGVAAGICLDKKTNSKKGNIFVILGEGDLNEGSTWEALMFINHYNLYNLIIIIDYNKLQSLDYTKNTIKLEPLTKKFLSFGFNCEIINGHDHKKIKKNIKKIQTKKKTSIIICNTIKGKGIKLMQNKVEWHYKNPTKEILDNFFNRLP